MEKKAECFCRRYIFRQLRSRQLSLRRTPAGIGTRADMSTLEVNKNQAKRVSAMDNGINYHSILTK